MKLAVLGSSGGMGRYFVLRFLEDGHLVAGHDVTASQDPPRKLALARSNSEAALGADAVLLSVPVRETVKVGREVVPHMKKGAVLVEMASVKTGVIEGLEGAIEGKRVRLLSIHPMFGPLSTAVRPKILVLGGRSEITKSEGIFPWADLIRVDKGDHDVLMAYALSLVHAVNIAFASTVSKGTGIRGFQKVSSPISNAQLTLAQAVLSQDPALYSLIQTENPHSSDAISAMIKELRSLQRLVKGKRSGEFERRFASLAGEFPSVALEKALGRVYSSLG